MGADKAYGSYTEMLNDPEVDAIYIATPHVFHREHTLLCLKHKKAVLCEKPFAMNKDQVKEMIKECCGKYKYIIIDSPPSLGLLTINVLTAAHSIIIPIQCEYYALEGLSQLLNTVRLIQNNLNKNFHQQL